MKPVRVFRIAALVCYFGLLGWVVAWQAWLSPPQLIPRSVALLLLAGPLLLPLRGLLHGRPFTHMWGGFLALFYFLHGVGEVYSNPGDRLLALVEVVLSMSFYLTALFYARLRNGELRERSPAA